MANFNGILDQFNTPQAPGDLNLINQTLAINQNKYDLGEKMYNDNLAQLKQQENLLARPEDRQRFSQNVQGLINEINGKEGGINWAKRGLTNKINSYTNTALDEYTLGQIGIGLEIKSFNSVIAKSREKKDGSYADQNYIDAQEQAGLGDYMSGKTNKIGSLSYSNYVDVKGEKSKLTSEYVAKFLLQPQYLGTDKSEPAYYKDSYGNNVNVKTVEKYVESQLDPKDLNQIKIDARQSLGKMDSNSYNRYAKQYYTNKNSEEGVRLAETEAYLRNNPDKAEAYKDGITAVKLQIEDNKKRIASDTFDKNEIYEMYKDVLIKDIASPFNIQNVTKIERDKLPFEIMNADRNYELEVRKLKNSEDEEKKAISLSNGTATTVPTIGEDKKTTDFEDIQKATYKTSTALDSYLKTQNIDGYKNKTPQEQWTYMLSLKATDSRVAGNNATLLNLTKDFQFAQKGYATIVNGKNEDFKEVVSEKYNDMIGGNINTSNLATTAPLTASLIKSKKMYETLSDAEKSGLNAEFASQMIQFGDVDKDSEEFYKKIIIKNKSLLSKNNPTILKTIENSTSPESSKGFFRNTWDAIKAPFGFIADVAQEAGNSMFVDPYNRITQGDRYADEQNTIFDTQQKKDFNQDSKNIINAGETALRRNPLTGIPLAGYNLVMNQDSNITELQSGDLNMSGKLKKDVGQSFRDFNNKLSNDIREQSKGYQENLKSNQAFTFSTASKAQAQIAIKIENGIAASKDGEGKDYPIPANDNNYTIYREGDGFRVKYKTGIGKEQVYAEAYLQNLPDEVVQNYDLTKQNWSNSPENKKIELDPVTIKSYTDANKRSQDIETMYNNGVLDQNMQNVLYQNPSSTPFATNEELLDKIKTEKGQEYYNKNKGTIDSILQDEYKAIPFINPATQRFQFRLNYSNNKNSPAFDLGTNKNEHEWDLKYRTESLKFKLEQIYSL